MEKLSQPRRREPRRLSRREGPDDEGTDDEGKHAPRFLRREAPVRSFLDGGDLGIDEPTHLREQRRIAHGFGEHADPTAGRHQICVLIELERAFCIGEQPVALVLVTADALSKPEDQVLEQCAEQFGLVLEVVMNETRGHPRLGRDGRNRRAGIAVVRQDGRESREYFSPSFFTVAGSSHRLVE